VDRFISLPHRFYGIGIGYILKDLNYLLNHSVNQILNHGDLYNSPPFIHPLDGSWNPEQNVFGPGQTFGSDNADGFKILATPDIKASQITMITFIEGFIQKSLGINDFTLGGGSGNIIKNDTAHGLAGILRETNRRIDFYAQNSHDNFLTDLLEMLLKQAQLFLDEAEIPKITDEEGNFEFNKIFNSDIQGFYDLKIYADSLTSNKEFEQMKWQNAIQIFSKIIDPTTGFPVKDIKKIANKWLKSMGEDFPDQYDIPGVGMPQIASMTGGNIQGGPKIPSPQNVSRDQVNSEGGRLGSINP